MLGANMNGRRPGRHPFRREFEPEWTPSPDVITASVFSESYAAVRRAQPTDKEFEVGRRFAHLVEFKIAQ
jgi:hypothetical protein